MLDTITYGQDCTGLVSVKSKVGYGEESPFKEFNIVHNHG